MLDDLVGRLAVGFSPGLPLAAVLGRRCSIMSKSTKLWNDGGLGLIILPVTSTVALAKSFHLAKLSFLVFTVGVMLPRRVVSRSR